MVIYVQNMQAMKFINLLKADKEVMAVLTVAELEALFDYNYYLRYVDDVFRRLGLTDKQWIQQP